MAKVVIIGAGNLGSRHLQGAKLARETLEIHVVEPASNAMELAKSRYEDVSTDQYHTTHFHSKIEGIPKEVDVAIIATSSGPRFSILKELLDHSSARYLILEKFLFPRREEYRLAEEMIKQHRLQTWVNCPRRMMPFYQKLKERLIDAPFVTFEASGCGWGLASNAIHFFDLFQFLSGDHRIEFDPASQNISWIGSKRSGYLEAAGNLYGFSSKQNTINLASFDQPLTPVTLTVKTKDYSWHISENDESTAYCLDNRSGLLLGQEKFPLVYQSQLTGPLIEDLIRSGDCQLTRFEESSEMHLKILAAFEANQAKTSHEACLIT